VFDGLGTCCRRGSRDRDTRLQNLPIANCLIWTQKLVFSGGHFSSGNITIWDQGIAGIMFFSLLNNVFKAEFYYTALFFRNDALMGLFEVMGTVIKFSF
jgi:hypothetical protein